MKILLIGSFENYWSTNNEMFKYLKLNNFKVIKFDYRVKQKKPNCFLFIVDKFFSFLRRFNLTATFGINMYTSILGRKKIINQIIKLIKKEDPNYILVCKGDSINLGKLQKYKNKLIYYFMDPVNMAKKIRVDILSSYCKYSISTFGKVSNNLMNATNQRHNLQGVDINVFKIEKDWHRRKDALLFVGNITPKRRKIIKKLKQMGVKIDCYGIGWENKPIYFDQLNNLYNQYKFALNLCQDNYGFSVRVQQSLCSGNIVISDYCEDFNTFKNDLSNLKIFKTIDQFKRIWEMRHSINYEKNINDLSWSKILKEDFNWITSL